MKALVAKRIDVYAFVIVLRFRVESNFVQLRVAGLLPFAAAAAAATAAAIAPRAARHNDGYTNASGGGATATVTHYCGMGMKTGERFDFARQHQFEERETCFL
jgi:hypothetical protein